MFYTNVNGVIGAKSRKPIKNSHDEVFESDQDIAIGSILVDGEWVEPQETEEEILAKRAQAYANAINGSDALFIEYQALLAKGSENAETAKEAWLARREEIKLQYPKTETGDE